MLFLLFGQIHIKKTWTRLLPFHILEAFALPNTNRTDNVKAHADISKHTIQQCIDMHITYPYPVSIYRCYILICILKVAKFLKCQNMRNKRFNIKFITPTPRISIRILGVRLTFTNVIKLLIVINKF